MLLEDVYSFFLDGACTLPSELNGFWWDSRVGTKIQFQGQHILSGWTVTVNSQLAVTYKCKESDATRWAFM